MQLRSTLYDDDDDVEVWPRGLYSTPMGPVDMWLCQEVRAFAEAEPRERTESSCVECRISMIPHPSRASLQELIAPPQAEVEVARDAANEEVEAESPVSHCTVYCSV